MPPVVAGLTPCLGAIHRNLPGNVQPVTRWTGDSGGVSETPQVRVLIVDDEPSLVELLSVSLRFQGFEVETATNGAEGLDKARAFRPTL